jgi:hypothetical protein
MKAKPSTITKIKNCELVHSCFEDKPLLASQIHEKLKEKGHEIAKKNLFPYLEELKAQGRLQFIPGTRPRLWVAANTPMKKPLDPAVELSPELALMMGYTGIAPVGGVLIEPLEQIKSKGYGQPKRSRKRVPVFIQSGLQGSIYQD